MKNNTAEGSINVVYPYRIEVKVKDVTTRESLNKLQKDDDVNQMQAYSMALDLFEVTVPGDVGGGYDLSDTVILIEEHYYQFEMSLYDKDGHLITLTDNLSFQSLNLDEKFVEVIKQNKIGSEILIKTKTIKGDDQVKINSVHRLAEIRSPKTSEKFTNFEMTRLQ